jgi:transposase|tara:strand:+ start:5087 stop:5395 length:309 start_codon:yes stop_codon:yes gene_type:complete
MTKTRKPYNTYPKEFKLEALRLMKESNKPTSEIAMELGIRRNQLYKWKEQMTKKGDVASAKKGRPKKEDQSELTSLRQELTRLKEENEILKKAAVFFAKELD